MLHSLTLAFKHFESQKYCAVEMVAKETYRQTMSPWLDMQPKNDRVENF